MRWEGLHIGIFVCILILSSNKESGGYLSEVLPLFAWGHVFNLFSLHFNIGLPVHQVSQHCDCAMRAKVIIIFPNDHLYRAFKTTECYTMKVFIVPALLATHWTRCWGERGQRCLQGVHWGGGWSSRRDKRYSRMKASVQKRTRHSRAGTHMKDT